MQFNFVRRIDDLGRIVIPKEIRNKLNFNFGDLLDLNVNLDSLIIKKNNSIFKNEYIEEIISLVDFFNDYDIVLTDTEKVIAKSNSIVIEVNEKISVDLKKLILEHKSNNFVDGIAITDNYILEKEVFVKALIKESNTVGLLILKPKNDNNRNVNVFLNIVANLLLQ